MRPDEFFEIIDGIDDDIILDIPDANAEEPTKVVIESKETPFWVVALSAACLLCALVSGVFIIAKIKTSLPVESGANAPASYEDSSFESDSSSDSSYNGDESTETMPGKIFFSKIKAGDTIYSERCIKDNDLDYAVVYIDECSNITEENPVYISICKAVGTDLICVSETLKITSSEKQVHIIRYTEQCGRYSNYRLKREYKSTNYGYATLNGHWKP